MNLGEHHTASHVFPPPVHTLAGALRTAVLVQKGISFDAYGKGEAPGEIYDFIGKPGKAAPFHLIGPLFMKGDHVYVPAPYSWFMEKDTEEQNGKVRIIKGQLLKSRLIKSEAIKLVWAKGEKNEMVSIGGMWTRKEDLHSTENYIEVKQGAEFFENESRTGIALRKDRSVREGHLYSFNHTRMKKDVSLVFGTDIRLPLHDRGVLKIGAEQRFGWYERMSQEILGYDDKGNQYLSLSILEGSNEANMAVIATGKILYFGGWDLHTGFHKPMKGFFPAGTVFGKRINNNLISIKGVETC